MATVGVKGLTAQQTAGRRVRTTNNVELVTHKYAENTTTVNRRNDDDDEIKTLRVFSVEWKTSKGQRTSCAVDGHAPKKLPSHLSNTCIR